MLNIKGIADSGFITLESSKSTWILLESSEEVLETTALFDLDEKGQIKKTRVKLVIKSVLSPKTFVFQPSVASVKMEAPDENVLLILNKAMSFSLNHLLNKNIWLLVGSFKDDPKTELFILHYENINISVYALKTKD